MGTQKKKRKAVFVGEKKEHRKEKFQGDCPGLEQKKSLTVSQVPQQCSLT